jgi:hypothetical protein
MLERTFLHIQGIGPKTETRLWERGIRTWRDFLDQPVPVLSKARDPLVRQELEASVRHREDIRFFSKRLPASESWRLFGAFRRSCVYLDIETSGGFPDADEITVIGIYDGVNVRTFVNGRNLEAFEDAISGYQMVVTFNGGSFDLPYIRRWFPGIELPPAHIDLRFLLRRLGYTGGLKRIETACGLAREADIDGMDGWEAVRLWRAHEWGDPDALDRLVRYNTADIVNLEPLMEMGYRAAQQLVLPPIL